MTVQHPTVEELAACVPDGASVAIGGTLFTRMPVALLRALCERRPRHLHYICWGGGFPLEMLLEVDAVDHATLCFSSLDIFGQAPRFRREVESGRLELTELTAHAFHQAISAGRRRLPSEPMIWPAGSDLPTLPGFPRRTQDPVTGQDIGAVAALRPDVLLLHAQAADDDGNIEIVGARGVDLTIVPAARTVLVTVEEIVPRGELGRGRNAVVIPHHLVTGFAVAPGGAWPTSCLPYYLSDYAALAEWSQAASVVTDVPQPRTTATRRLPETTAAQVSANLVRHGTGQPPEQPTVDEWMTCWLARQYDNDSVCSVGAVSPLASASYLLAKATHAPGLTLITNGGAYIDVAARPLLFGLGEWLDALTASAHCGGEESYELFYQAGLVTYEVVSVAQIDARARTNNRWVTSPSGRHVRLPGQGGMADVADMHRNFLIYLPRQSPLNTPESVDFVTAARSLATETERLAAGYQAGHVRLVTNLAVFGLDTASGRLALEEVFPWTTWDTLVNATGFRLDGASFDTAPMVKPPTVEELAALRERVDPIGIRRLEFVPASDRLSLLGEVIAREAAAVREALTEAARTAAASTQGTLR